MAPELTITIDGRTVYRAEVTTKVEVRRAMEDHPPTAARGGVVQLRAGRRIETVALSGHSIHGPRWSTASCT